MLGHAFAGAHGLAGAGRRDGPPGAAPRSDLRDPPGPGALSVSLLYVPLSWPAAASAPRAAPRPPCLRRSAQPAGLRHPAAAPAAGAALGPAGAGDSLRGAEHRQAVSVALSSIRVLLLPARRDDLAVRRVGCRHAARQRLSRPFARRPLADR